MDNNLETILEIIPKTKKYPEGEARLNCRWSISDKGWIVGYGHNSTIKKREECGRGPTLLEAVIDLNKKENAERSMQKKQRG